MCLLNVLQLREDFCRKTQPRDPEDEVLGTSREQPQRQTRNTTRFQSLSFIARPFYGAEVTKWGWRFKFRSFSERDFLIVMDFRRISAGESGLRFFLFDRGEFLILDESKVEIECGRLTVSVR